jgi:hypothetical protein
MQNALVNLGIENEYREALIKIGYSLEALYTEEVLTKYFYNKY